MDASTVQTDNLGLIISLLEVSTLIVAGIVGLVTTFSSTLRSDGKLNKKGKYAIVLTM